MSAPHGPHRGRARGDDRDDDSDRHRGDHRGGHRGSRILVVDDNAMNVQLAVYLLNHAAFVVESATDARQAMLRIATFQPDLILMDIQMPGMDGLELTRLLKADPSTRQIVIVAFTAYAMKGDEARLRAVGCDGYLSKPIDVASFAGQVRAFLGSANG